MANLNKVILIGRLTRDPESRTFSNGGKVAKFGFAVDRTGRRTRRRDSGKTSPMFIDCEAFNRGEFGQAGGHWSRTTARRAARSTSRAGCSSTMGRQDDRPEAVEAQDRRRGASSCSTRSRTGRAVGPRAAGGPAPARAPAAAQFRPRRRATWQDEPARERAGTDIPF